MLSSIKKDELCQISLTGLRSLVLLGLLIKAPRSLTEIREAFIHYNILEESNSDDILRIDLNTLRTMGCEISRAGQKTNYKYELSKHPFSLNIDRDEIVLLKRAYNKVKDNVNIATLMQFDELFRKISEYINDENIREELCGISSLKRYNLSFIRELQYDCKCQRTLNFLYESPASNRVSEKHVIAQKIVYKNNKVYLYGYDSGMKEFVTLNISRIKKILFKHENNENINSNSLTVKFKLRDFGFMGLSDEEEILSGSAADGYIVEGKYHNHFVAVQRILSFGPNCTVIEPADFRNDIICSLRSMRKIYYE